MAMTIRSMAALALCKKCDWRIKPLLKHYSGILNYAETMGLATKGPWLTLNDAATRLMHTEEPHGQTLDTLAGEHLNREINNKLEVMCNRDLAVIVPEIGGEAPMALEQYQEGLITESELLMKLLDMLSRENPGDVTMADLQS